MRIHRFVGNFDLSRERVRITDREFLNQIKNVLRLSVGNDVILGDGKLNEAIATIAEVGSDFVELEVVSRGKNEREPKRNVIVYCSILKGEHFELVVEKTTEVGAREIVPIVSKRTVKLDIRKERLEKIIKEAAEQSGRGIVPSLRDPIRFEKALEEAGKNDLNLFFDSQGKPFDTTELEKAKTVGVFVGPEGGWDENELKIAKKEEFYIASLGPLTLRAETAAVVATYLTAH
ncbi:16S rRNA (uracil(1498)-N(3))-methyltransferase [Candidatus Parcubacteria bacterium]|nr:MAG: 16S rRNA (uracil(1498)-N(3))-methyltransferase [Candidatus Parcubacteria bacterium]